MEANTLFEMALGLGGQWKVVDSEIDLESKELRLELDFAPGTRFDCPECGESSPVHDTVRKSWRHMDFWQHRTLLTARVPRVKCATHGVRQVDVPWARAGSGFTLMMEAMIVLLSKEMPVSAAAAYLGESDHRLWRVLKYWVGKAHKAKCWSAVRRVMIDETSTKKGHRYATNFVDADTGDLLFTTEGKDGTTLESFAQEMLLHGAKPEQITELVMDMSRAFVAGAAKVFPGARVVFDHFHIMQLAGKALDSVRKALRAEGADLTGSLWAIRGNEWTRSQEQLAIRRHSIHAYPKLGRALALRDTLQDVLADNEPDALRWWCSWAQRSRLEPFRKLAKSIKIHWEGILAFMETRLTNAAMEALNGILQLAKRSARGFRNFDYFRITAYLKTGGLNILVTSL